MITSASDTGNDLMKLAREVFPDNEDLLIEVEESLRVNKIKIARALILGALDRKVDDALLSPQVAQEYYNRIGLSQTEVNDIRSHSKNRPKRH